MSILRDIKQHIGCKLQVDTQDKTWHAVLEFVDAVTKRIGFSHLQVFPTMKREVGLLVLYPSEIISYSVIDKEKIEKHKPSIKTVPPNAASLKNNAIWLNDHESSEDDDDDESDEQVVVEEEKEYILELPPRFQHVLPNDQILIDSFDDSFYAAIKHIKREDCIGVSFEGKDIGRFGELCIISISTGCCTFIFDICSLKGNAFKCGLKGIFENPDIEKVIHNCMWPSDALFHLYGTEIVNPFDTQVSNLFIEKTRRRNGKTEEKAWDLVRCLEQYLDIQREEFFTMAPRFSVLKRSTLDWKVRPLPNALRAIAIYNAIFLRHLRDACISKMLNEFHKAVNMVNTVVRDRTTEELELENGDTDYPNLHFSGLSFKVIQATEYFSGNKKNPIEAYLNEVKDYEIFKPITGPHNDYISENESEEEVTPLPTNGNQKPEMMMRITSSTEEACRPQRQPKIELTKIKKDTATGEPTLTKNSNNFQWPAVEEKDRRPTSCILIPAGLTIPPQRRKGNR